jgi:hypothetical protein
MSKEGTLSFKQEHPLEKRKLEAERIRSKYPERVPVRTLTSRWEALKTLNSLFVLKGDLRT